MIPISVLEWGFAAGVVGGFFGHLLFDTLAALVIKRRYDRMRARDLAHQTKVAQMSERIRVKPAGTRWEPKPFDGMGSVDE